MMETPVWIHLSCLTKSTFVLSTTSPLLLDWPLLLLDLLVWVRLVLVLQVLDHQEQHCFIKDYPGRMVFDMIIYTLTLVSTCCIAVYTLARVFGVEGELSAIARQGSGSACRSMYGGFVQWIMGQKEDGKDSIAQQVEPDSHWPELRILVLVVGQFLCISEIIFLFILELQTLGLETIVSNIR